MKKNTIIVILIFTSLSILFSGCGDEEKTSTSNIRSSSFSNNSSNFEEESTDELDTSSEDVDVIIEEVSDSDFADSNDISNNNNDATLEILKENAKKSVYNCINDYLFIMQNAQYINTTYDSSDELIEVLQLCDQLDTAKDYSVLQELINKFEETHKNLTTMLSNNGLKATKVIEYDDFSKFFESSDFDNIPEPDTETIEQFFALFQLISEYINYGGYLDQQSINELTAIQSKAMYYQEVLTNNPLALFDSSVMSAMISDYNKWVSQLKNICYRNGIDFSSIY